MEKLNNIVKQLGKILLQHDLKVVTAESCTGGLVAAAITEIPGSSQWFDRGFVTYSNQAKQELLGVEHQLIQIYGAVSEEVVKAMADGAQKNSRAQISMAITGIAGPSGGSAVKPIGTVWFAWKVSDRPIFTSLQVFAGSRALIRNQATYYCLARLLQIIQDHLSPKR